MVKIFPYRILTIIMKRTKNITCKGGGGLLLASPLQCIQTTHKHKHTRTRKRTLLQYKSESVPRATDHHRRRLINIYIHII